MRISVPIDIADGTPDGTTYPNSVEARIDHVVGGEVRRSQGSADTALVTVVNPSPPPVAVKTATPDLVAAGSLFTWNVQATLEPGKVWFDLGWTDRLPTDTSFIRYGTPTCVVTGTATPCSPTLAMTSLSPVSNGDGSTTLGWFVGDVAGEATISRTITLPIQVRYIGDGVAGAAITNVVTGFSNDVDAVATLTGPADPGTFDYPGDPVVGTAEVAEPDLTIIKTATAPGPFQAGDPVAYTVTVTNEGEATAYDVPVSDTPDASLLSLTSTSPLISKGWTSLDPRLEWFIPTIAPGATVTLDVSGIVAGDYMAKGVRETTNTATVVTYTSRPVTEPTARTYPAVQSAATVPLVAQNLTVAKFAGAGCSDVAMVYAPGDSVDWCVVLDNVGDAPAHNVTLSDVLPVGWTYETGSATVDGAASEPTIVTTGAGSQRLMWSFGQVGPADRHVVRYSTIGAAGSGLVTNTVIADSTLPNGDPVPNAPNGFRSTAQAMAAPLGAGLQIAKLPNSQRFACDRAGCPVTWEIVVVNSDDLDLANLVVTDLLPAGLTYDSSDAPAGWSAAAVGAAGSGPGGTTPVTWTASGPFASGADATFELTALVPAGTTERSYLNHAQAVADGVPQVENQALATVYATGSIGDFVWNDVDADGIQDPDELPVAGVTVQLLDANGGVVGTTATDIDGHYLFTGLDPGDYRVRFIPLVGWLFSPAHRASDDVDSDAAADGRTPVITIASGTDDLTQDAGMYLPIPELAVRKSVDVNEVARAAESSGTRCVSPTPASSATPLAPRRRWSTI